MIERLVLLKCHPDLDPATARDAIAEAAARIYPTLPGVCGWRVGRPADASASAAWDLLLAVRFAAIADVQPYLEHPEHRAFVDDVLSPRVAFRRAWNFELP